MRAIRVPRVQLALISFVQVATMSLWFSAAAVTPALQQEWGVSASTAGWLTSSVQLGFVVGALLSAMLNLADRFAPQMLLAASAVVGAVATFSIVLFSDGITSAIPLRFLTGIALAGVYPVGMKLVTTWFNVNRALALGVLVGALTVGSALPYLLRGWSIAAWQPILVTAGTLACLGAIVSALLVRSGPDSASSPPFTPRYMVELFREREARLINFGYFGHMWELYAMWAWLPAYVGASLTAREHGVSSSLVVGGMTFLAIGVFGLIGAVTGGALGARYGAKKVARVAMIVSATCCGLTVFAFGMHPLFLSIFLAIWGAVVIADSAQFSAALSVTVDPRFVGTALTVQTAVGFALTTVTIQGLPLVADQVGWRFSFVVLAIGPILGACAIGAAMREQVNVTRHS